MPSLVTLYATKVGKLRYLEISVLRISIVSNIYCKEGVRLGHII